MSVSRGPPDIQISICNHPWPFPKPVQVANLRWTLTRLNQKSNAKIKRPHLAMRPWRISAELQMLLSTNFWLNVFLGPPSLIAPPPVSDGEDPWILAKAASNSATRALEALSAASALGADAA